MAGSRSSIALYRRLSGRVFGLAMGIGLLVAACGPAPTTTTGAATTQGTASVAQSPPSSTADCESITTCYTPQQLEVAYGVQPLLQRGIDGRGETVVLPGTRRNAARTRPRSPTCARTSPPTTTCSTCRRRASR